MKNDFSYDFSWKLIVHGHEVLHLSTSTVPQRRLISSQSLIHRLATQMNGTQMNALQKVYLSKTVHYTNNGAVKIIYVRHIVAILESHQILRNLPTTDT